MKVYYDKDADLSLVKGKNVTIIGYGSQGHAHAQNLNDSGVKVTVGVRKGGPSWAKAEKAGLKVADVADAVRQADVVMMLLPDEQIAAVYKNDVEPNIKQGASLAFAHGFNVHYGQVVPRADLDVWMVAPKAPGHTVRSTYTQGGGVPHLIAVHADKTGKARDLALSYATANGGGKAGIIETNFREETETDLFVGQQHHHDIGLLHGIGHIGDLQAGLLGFRPRGAALAHAHCHFHAAVVQVLRVRMAL